MRNFILVFSLLAILIPCNAETIIVDQNGFADFNNIQDAINYSWHGDVIIVRPGTYNENVYFNCRAITLTSTNANDHNVVESTIISADAGYSVTFDFGEDNDSILQGFTITSGGIFCYDSSPTIRINIIRNCAGAGIYGEYDAEPVIANNTIINNSGRGISECDGQITNNTISGNQGGGIDYCDGTIANNIISGNLLGNYAVEGGGLLSCGGTIRENTISGNVVNGEFVSGGGLSTCGGTITNNMIFGNSAIGSISSYGGGLCNCGGTILNNTIIGNQADGYGGALHSCNAVRNNIIAFNRAASTGGICGTSDNSYNDLWMNEGGNWGDGSTAGVGDICVDPLFADTDSNDFHLKSEAGRWDPNIQSWVVDEVTSRCIDAGDPCDSIGYEPNPNGGRINMGAYGGTSEASKSTNGSGPEPPPLCINRPLSDLNGDCKVDFTDFAIMSSEWLNCGLADPNDC